jgi:hypothetical protein
MVLIFTIVHLTVSYIYCGWKYYFNKKAIEKYFFALVGAWKYKKKNLSDVLIL